MARVNDGPPGWTRAAVLLATLSAGCADPSTRISGELTRYGLDVDRATCIGDRLEANLSVGQLQQLGRAARAFEQGDVTPGRLSASDFIRVSSRIDDARVPVEVAKAAAACGLLDAALPVLG